jgi:hypothetical protein
VSLPKEQMPSNGGEMARKPQPQDKKSLELAQQKHKITRQREEIAKLKRTIKMLRDKLKEFAA